MDYFNNLSYFNDTNEINDFNRFSSVENLVKFAKYQKEVIVYPAGAVGERFLDYLQYFNEIKNFICLTTYQTRAWNNTELVFSHNLPVIPLEFLVHMKETALIIVAAASTQHDDIRSFIQEFGFKKVVYVNDELHALIARTLNDWYKSEDFMDWFMNYVWEKLHEMEHRIAEQNEITAYNTAAFSAYQDCFNGKKIVIVANGPTMKDYEPIKDAIHIGLNKAYLRKDIEFDYMFAIDYLPEMYDAIPFNEIKDKVFLGAFLDRIPAHWLNFPENCFFNDKTVKFYLNSCARYKDQPMYRDICNHGLADFGSVIFSAIQFALWTHPKEIYLVGCDTTDTGHFYDEDDEESPSLAVPHWVKVGYARVKMFARLFYPNTEIISVNPVALKGLFRDIYTDDL